MQTIRIDVKDIYVSNVLEMLNSLQDIMIDSVKLDSLSESFNQTPNKEFQQDKASLSASLKSYKENSSKNFSSLDKNYWNSVQSRLIARHSRGN